MIEPLSSFREMAREDISAMLSAYFDDSGTHDDSEIMVYGGLIGTDVQWAAFEIAWKALLKSPPSGKVELPRFHMAQCVARKGKLFGRYSKDESDAAVAAFTQVILDHDLSGYARAIEIKAWNDLITGPSRRVLGDPERNAVTSCILTSLQWARDNSDDDRLAFIFDNRPHRREANERIFSIFQRNYASGDAGPPEPSITFEASECFVPLQGADIVAWEAYRRANDILKIGRTAPMRDNLSKLSESGRFQVQMQGRSQIEQVASIITANPMLVVSGELIDQPTRVFPPSLRVHSEDGSQLRLEPVVFAGLQWPLGLSQKQWTPVDPSQGSTPWPHPPLLRRVTPEPSRSEGKPNREDQT